MSEKKDFWDKFNEEEEKAKEVYKRQVEGDKDKTFMDILPKEFKTFKRSVLKRDVLDRIDKVTEYLNKCPLYNGRVFDKKEVTRYMMIGTYHWNFYLAEQYIPRQDDWVVWDELRTPEYYALPEEERAPLREEFRKNNKEKLNLYRDLTNELSYACQVWRQYEESVNVRNRTEEGDMEDDGFPRTGRGNMCYMFTPVKGDLPKSDQPSLKLHNPRTKKDVVYTKIKYKKSDDIYKALNEKGKEVFLADWDDINNAWDALFSSNKEVYSGWWNRTMIIK